MPTSKEFVREVDQDLHFVAEDILYIFRLLVAFIFIIIGFIGIILPIVPDWPLLLVGIIMLDTHGKFRHMILKKTPERYRKNLEKILFVIKLKK